MVVALARLTGAVGSVIPITAPVTLQVCHTDFALALPIAAWRGTSSDIIRSQKETFKGHQVQLLPMNRGAQVGPLQEKGSVQAPQLTEHPWAARDAAPSHHPFLPQHLAVPASHCSPSLLLGKLEHRAICF